jgi:hypothetical protein
VLQIPIVIFFRAIKNWLRLFYEESSKAGHLGPNVGRKFKGLSLGCDLACYLVVTCGGQTLLPELITEFTVCSLLQNISTEYFMQTYAAHEEDRPDFKQMVWS